MIVRSLPAQREKKADPHTKKHYGFGCYSIIDVGLNMASSYPVRYRDQPRSRGASSSQGARPRRSTAPRRVANDNRPLPRAANDNTLPKSRLPRGWKPYAGFARGLALGLGRGGLPGLAARFLLREAAEWALSELLTGQGCTNCFATRLGVPPGFEITAVQYHNATQHSLYRYVEYRNVPGGPGPVEQDEIQQTPGDHDLPGFVHNWQFRAGDLVGTGRVSAGTRGIIVFTLHVVNGINVMLPAYWLWRVAPGSTSAPFVTPEPYIYGEGDAFRVWDWPPEDAPAPLELPAPVRWVDPFSDPIGIPLPEPQAPPWWVQPYLPQNPERDPIEQPLRVPARRPQASPDAEEGRRFGPQSLPSRAPGRNPRFTVHPQVGQTYPDYVVGPGVAPSIGSRPGRPNIRVRQKPIHRRRPPGRNEKERKFVGAINRRSALGKALNFVTEGLDILNALWDALPDGAQTKKKGVVTRPDQKLRDLYDNWEQVDWDRAFDNIIENQVEDYVLGKAGQKLAKANRLSGHSFGYGIGPAL